MKKNSVFLVTAIIVLCLMLPFGLTGCGTRRQEPEKEKQEETKPDSVTIDTDNTQDQSDNQESDNQESDDQESNGQKSNEEKPEDSYSDEPEYSDPDDEEEGDQSVYFMELESLYNRYETVEYALSDVTGDGAVELLAQCYPTEDGGSGSIYLIYTATNNNHDIEKLLETTGYGLEKIICYKESESLVLYFSGHGHESYDYYRMEGGEYEYVASKGRQMADDGNESDESWIYWSDSAQTSESDFYDTIEGMEDGQATEVNYDEWQEYQPDSYTMED